MLFFFIQIERKQIFQSYHKGLYVLENQKRVKLPSLPDYATVNGHMFYIICRSLEDRSSLISSLKRNGYQAVFHYQSLHDSIFYRDNNKGLYLENSDNYTNCLVRLPLYAGLDEYMVDDLITKVNEFFSK